MDYETKRRTLETLRAQVKELEDSLELDEAAQGWQSSGFYPAYQATVGFLLGIFGATTSLLFNVVGSLLFGKNALELIRVYLTFPLGERALQLTGQSQDIYAVGDGVILAVGCCLYLVTGMILGIPVTMAIAWWAPRAGLGVRLVIASLVSLAIWVVNIYGILSWLQPMLFGGRWIVETVPWWVGAATHLIFGWTIALAYPLARYQPYRRPTESQA